MSAENQNIQPLVMFGLRARVLGVFALLRDVPPFDPTHKNTLADTECATTRLLLF